MKVGIIRCQQTEDYCPGTTDFEVAKESKEAFEEVGSVEVVGFVSCGGCPGKRAVARAVTLVDRGVQAIVVASCIRRGNPVGMPCLHFKLMRQAIKKSIGDDILIIDWTH